MWRRAQVLLFVLAIWLVLPATPAQATFPDKNGRIAFRRFLNEDRSWGAVFTINADGFGERQVTFPALQNRGCSRGLNPPASSRHLAM